MASLTIGLPVYNGARFVASAIESILAQTHTDFRLVVADNASTDQTPDIVEEFGRADNRVELVRRPENIGAPANFNTLVTETRTPLFKWAAADDLHAPTFLERCVSILDGDASAIGAYTRAVRINDRGEIIDAEEYRLRTESTSAHVRFRDVVSKPHSCFSVFGVFRTEELRRTGLIRSRGAGDRILLAELALRGRTVEHPAYLLSRRVHEGSFSSGTRTGHNHPERFWGPAVATSTDDASASLGAVFQRLVEESDLPAGEKRSCGRQLRWRAARKSVERKVLRPLRDTIRQRG